MGWFGDWLREWRATYDTYPVATAVTWIEMGVAMALFVLSMAVTTAGGRVPVLVAAFLLAGGAGFVVWFAVVRQPVVERLVAG
jgi:hypothetical protein